MLFLEGNGLKIVQIVKMKILYCFFMVLDIT